MACGGEHSLVATEAGDLFAWGWGRYGNLGIGPAEDRLLPSKVWDPPGGAIPARFLPFSWPLPQQVGSVTHRCDSWR